MKKLIEGVLGDIVDKSRRKFIKQVGAAGALATLPKGAKMLMESIAKKLPENLKDAKPFKVLERDAVRGYMKWFMNPRYNDFQNVYWKDNKTPRVKSFEIFSKKDIREIYQNAMKNKMKATGQSYDEVVDDFFHHAEELKDIGYEVIDEQTDKVVEKKSYYRKLLGGPEEDFE